MPELPEVETIANGVNARVRGRTIVSVWLGSKPEPFRSTPAELVKALTGSTIEHVRRVGKHIVVDLDARFCRQPSSLDGRSAKSKAVARTMARSSRYDRPSPRMSGR